MWEIKIKIRIKSSLEKNLIYKIKNGIEKYWTVSKLYLILIMPSVHFLGQLQIWETIFQFKTSWVNFRVFILTVCCWPLTLCRRTLCSGQRQPQKQKQQLKQLEALPSQGLAAAPLLQAQLWVPLVPQRPPNRKAVTLQRPLLLPVVTMMVRRYLFLILLVCVVCRAADKEVIPPLPK